MRVLICDDNRDAADTLNALVRLDRHETRVCYTGARCLEEARQFTPQVALLDIGMPGMTGYAVASALRALDFGKRMLLVAITGYTTTEDMALAREAGFDVHLAKPPDADRLLKIIAAAG